MAENNALDFDDLIWIPSTVISPERAGAELLAPALSPHLGGRIPGYQPHSVQFDPSTGNQWEAAHFNDWTHRSVFVVGDADQSIYSFRMADFTILMGFQRDFGDQLPDADTRTMVKLEENYRSTENILQIANALIENNTERIDKVLKPTRGAGEVIRCHRTDHELEEAEFVINQIRALERQHRN